MYNVTVPLQVSNYTGKNNRYPILDILGYLKNTHKIPNLGEWDKSQFGNLVGNSLIGICLTLPNLGFLWVFFKYPKMSKIGNPLFFPVNYSKLSDYTVRLQLCILIRAKYSSLCTNHIWGIVIVMIINIMLPRLCSTDWKAYLFMKHKY